MFTLCFVVAPDPAAVPTTYSMCSTKRCAKNILMNKSPLTEEEKEIQIDVTSMGGPANM